MWPLLLVACAPAPLSRELPVRWVQSRDESLEQAEAGLVWGLASVGAAPEGALLRDVTRTGDTATATLDFDAAGFDPRAQPALDVALAPLLDSGEIARFGGVDLGRVVMRLVYDPWTYYALTGACAGFDDWNTRFGPDAPGSFAATTSSVAFGERRVDYPGEVLRTSDLSFVARAGSGSLLDGSFMPGEAETVDALANGQLRFAAFDVSGELVALADPDQSAAGQPGTCQWCHEGHVQPAFAATAPVEGMLDDQGWNALVPAWNAILASEQEEFPGVDWDVATHPWLEHLAEDFVEPSVERLAREWGEDPAATEARVRADLRTGESGSAIVPRAVADAAIGLDAPVVQPWPRRYDEAVGAPSEALMRPLLDCRDPFPD